MVPAMRTLHVGLRVSDLERSLAFCTAVGYTVAGTVQGTAFGSLSMLQLPGRSVCHHRAGFTTRREVQTASASASITLSSRSNRWDATLADLAASGIAAERPALPGGADGPRISWITDPDGYRIEPVQWSAGHADGITKADFA